MSAFRNEADMDRRLDLIIFAFSDLEQTWGRVQTHTYVRTCGYATTREPVFSISPNVGGCSSLACRLDLGTNEGGEVGGRARSCLRALIEHLLLNI